MDYFDMNLNLSWEDAALRNAAREFAAGVMRPAAKALDAMAPEDAVADGSPLWTFFRKAYELGYHKALLPKECGGLGLTPLQMHLVNEELAWGSFGLTALLGVASFPFQFAWVSGDPELIETFGVPFAQCSDGSLRGCWAGTEPDHGSDVLGEGEEFFTSPKIVGNVKARPEGEEWVISGQKSAWVSGAKSSTHALLQLQVDKARGLSGWGCCIVPLDLPGVSRGKALNKIGQRDLNQAELFFDEVRIPKKWMVVGPNTYVPTLHTILAHANLFMGIMSTGLARAAFEEAFGYSKERVQGGKPIIQHYSMKQRLFEMFARVETSRALTRSVAGLNLSTPAPLLEYSMVAKTTCTKLALENAHDAIQILGGNGLTREYPVEKLFRDARATLIMDGNNEVLARGGGYILSETYPRAAV